MFQHPVMFRYHRGWGSSNNMVWKQLDSKMLKVKHYTEAAWLQIRAVENSGVRHKNDLCSLQWRCSRDQWPATRALSFHQCISSCSKGEADQDKLNPGVSNALHGVTCPSISPTLDKEKRSSRFNLTLLELQNVYLKQKKTTKNYKCSVSECVIQNCHYTIFFFTINLRSKQPGVK